MKPRFDTIMQTYEVPLWLHEDAGFWNDKVFTSVLFRAEKSFFQRYNKCLEENMKADLCYTFVEPFDCEKTYQNGELIEVGGCIYSSVGENTSFECGGWELKDKFKTDCYNEAWKYIAQIIAFSTAQKSVVGGHYKNSGHGVMVATNAGGRVAVTKDELAMKLKDYDLAIQETIVLFENFVRSYEGDCFDCVKECLPCADVDCCTEQIVNKPVSCNQLIPRYD